MMKSEKTSIAIIDNRPLVTQALTEQIEATKDMRVTAIGQVGNHVLAIAAAWQPDVLIISTDMPQAENNDVMCFQPLPVMRILNRQFPQIRVIFLVGKHLPVVAYLAEYLGVMGYILMHDARITCIVEVIRHILVGRKIYSKTVQEDLFYLIIQDKGLSDTQINILGAVVSDPNLSQEQIASAVGISHGTLRNAMSRLFQVCGVRNLTGALMATHAWDITQFQLKQFGREEGNGVDSFGRTVRPT